MSAEMACAEVRELAAEFVLRVLDDDTAARVRAHLATCPEVHDELAQLGGVLPYLAESLDPVAPRAELRGRVMAAARARLPVALVPDWAPDRPGLSQRVLFPRAGWAFAAVAAVAAVAVALSSVSLQAELDEARHSAAILRAALTAAAQPGARVALLVGTPDAPAVSGFAVVAPGGGALIIEGLPPAPLDRYYEAWYITAGVPRSAGTVERDPSGTGTLDGLSAAGPIDTLAVTLEPVGGGPGPDGPIYASGTLAAGSG